MLLTQQGTQKLEYLNISHNKFGKVGAKHLGFAISENTSLKELDLSWNHFRRKEATQLVRGIGVSLPPEGLKNVYILKAPHIIISYEEKILFVRDL